MHLQDVWWRSSTIVEAQSDVPKGMVEAMVRGRRRRRPLGSTEANKSYSFPGFMLSPPSPPISKLYSPSEMRTTTKHARLGASTSLDDLSDDMLQSMQLKLSRSQQLQITIPLDEDCLDIVFEILGIRNAMLLRHVSKT